MQKFINTIIHGDCIEEMRKLPDDSVDLIFADPPYYLQLPKGKRLKRADGSEIIPVDDYWDQFESYEDYDNFTQNWIKECQRILKKMNGGVQMKDTDWVFGLCKGNERLKDENGIKAPPTQKPLKLIQQVVLASSNKGDIVFDPFMGSGT